ncbi:hypothetical protein Tco_1507226 [Tanacetum coccineum]
MRRCVTDLSGSLPMIQSQRCFHLYRRSRVAECLTPQASVGDGAHTHGSGDGSWSSIVRLYCRETLAMEAGRVGTLTDLGSTQQVGLRHTGRGPSGGDDTLRWLGVIGSILRSESVGGGRGSISIGLGHLTRAHGRSRDIDAMTHKRLLWCRLMLSEHLIGCRAVEALRREDTFSCLGVRGEVRLELETQERGFVMRRGEKLSVATHTVTFIGGEMQNLNTLFVKGRYGGWRDQEYHSGRVKRDTVECAFDESKGDLLGDSLGGHTQLERIEGICGYSDSRMCFEPGLDQTLVMLLSSTFTNSHVLAGPNLEHSDVEITDASSQPQPEHMDEGFIATTYPEVQENLRALTAMEQDDSRRTCPLYRDVVFSAKLQPRTSVYGDSIHD